VPEAEPERPTDRRGTFLPVVGVGVLAGALAALAGARAWVTGSDASPSRSPLLPTTADAGEMPLAAALSLVVLACWGVLLVTRGLVRRAVAVLCVVASLGFAATVAVGFAILPDQVAEALREAGATSDTLGTELTAWFWVAVVAAVVLVVTGALAVAWCPAWPEMGSRYDAPGAAGEPADDVPPEERSNLDLWKQLDEGRDPTA
jgi:uncharacterized membrane protein (TIGR02234 family)